MKNARDNMNLEEEIELSINDIKTDGYRMSIGEIANLYKEKDLTIFPEYQRYFRWNETQKSDLIESIILGIPIPPIFVAQDSSGKWDVIDGLQRISTIMEFMGILVKRDSDNFYEPSRMIATKFLPSLEGKYWDKVGDPENSLTEEVRRKVKRRKLDLVIIDSTSNPTAKYELFQRLNTNGSELTAQEIRNCLMLMINKEFYSHFVEMAENEVFKTIIDISDKNEQEQFEKDLVTRYLVARNSNLEKINSQEDIKKFLTEQIILLMNDSNINMEKEKNDFIEAVTILNKVLKENSFKKYYEEKQRFEGSFSLSTFEAVLCGISEHTDSWSNTDKLVNRIKSIYEEQLYKDATIRGKRPVLRFKELTNFSKRFFRHEN